MPHLENTVMTHQFFLPIRGHCHSHRTKPFSKVFGEFSSSRQNEYRKAQFKIATEPFDEVRIVCGMQMRITTTYSNRHRRILLKNSVLAPRILSIKNKYCCSRLGMQNGFEINWFLKAAHRKKLVPQKEGEHAERECIPIHQDVLSRRASAGVSNVRKWSIEAGIENKS